MLTTREETYGSETAGHVDTVGFPANDLPFRANSAVLATPDWLADDLPVADNVFDVERSSIWKWRRRAAMVVCIAGIALAGVTFSLGSPISDYALVSSSESDGGPSADATAPAATETDDMALMALSSGSHSDLRLFGSDTPESPLAANGVASTTTTIAPTTTAVPWTEPVIEPESEWVNAGNGVAVPDVLLRIRFCESTNNYQAAHVRSSARGAYQFLAGSWSWYGHAARYGAATADLATPAQQDEAAVLTLKQDGTRPWKASFGCWGSESISPNYATARPPTTTTTSAPSTTTESTTNDSSTTTASTSTTAATSSTQPTTTGSTTTTAPSSTTTSTTTATTGSTDTTAADATATTANG